MKVSTTLHTVFARYATRAGAANCATPCLRSACLQSAKQSTPSPLHGTTTVDPPTATSALPPQPVLPTAPALPCDRLASSWVPQQPCCSSHSAADGEEHALPSAPQRKAPCPSKPPAALTPLVRHHHSHLAIITSAMQLQPVPTAPALPCDRLASN
jgi:hypothetical protein